MKAKLVRVFSSFSKRMIIVDRWSYTSYKIT